MQQLLVALLADALVFVRSIGSDVTFQYLHLSHGLLLYISSNKQHMEKME